MSGLVTERDLEEAERVFPGILRFYTGLPCKPATFLDLVRLYMALGDAPRSSGNPDITVS